MRTFPAGPGTVPVAVRLARLIHCGAGTAEKTGALGNAMKEAAIDIAWQGPLQCRDCGIRDLVLFADLQLPDFRLIHQPITEMVLRPGDALYHAGATATSVFTVRGGLLKLVQYQPDGNQRILRLLKQGDVAGMEALVETSYQHEAVVLEQVSVCRIPVEVVQRLSHETPRLHHQLLSRWQRALHDADTWLTSLSPGQAPVRVARLLVFLAGTRPDHSCFLPSRDDIGAMLGIASETASRVTAEFKRNNWIRELDPKHIQVDLAALRAMAQR
ncbi:MAG TPA: Crp/Fnr family transcriptional regulator [Gammaproteobacteria bacterium]|nr:Crp/Fnr family transcriptional regulator [Gammaproteobacteria bacterium]